LKAPGSVPIIDSMPRKVDAGSAVVRRDAATPAARGGAA
jgi:hypothetical protein